VQAPDIAGLDRGRPRVRRLLEEWWSAATEGVRMTTTRTTISGIDGVPHPVAGLERLTGAPRRVKDAALAVFTVALLLLVAF